jgi:hypothetical protein
MLVTSSSDSSVLDTQNGEVYIRRTARDYLIEIITDVDIKCLLHPSAVISVRSNVCVRPEDGYKMS